MNGRRHLYLGTPADNARDARERGRTRGSKGLTNGQHTQPHRRARGDRNGTHTKPHRVARGTRLSTLTVATVLAVYEAAMRGDRPQKDIAAEYGVTVGTVGAIKTGHSWCHVTGSKKYVPPSKR